MEQILKLTSLSHAIPILWHAVAYYTETGYVRGDFKPGITLFLRNMKRYDNLSYVSFKLPLMQLHNSRQRL